MTNEENIEMFLSLILYRCIPDPLLCHVGNWRYSHILLGAGNWSATEERCHWCMESSVALPRRYWHQQCCRVFQCCSVLQYHHRLVSLLLRPGVRTEIITVVNMKVTVLWNATPCSLIYIYWLLEGCVSSLFHRQLQTLFTRFLLGTVWTSEILLTWSLGEQRTF